MSSVVEVFVDSSWKKAGIYCEELGWVFSIPYEKQLSTNHGEFAAMQLAFMALTESVERLKVYNMPVFVYTDSWLVYKAIQGNWNIKKLYLKELLEQILIDQEMLSEFGIDVRVHWIPREKNTKADELTHG